METQIITPPSITLEWSDWADWEDIKIDCRRGDGIHIPNYKSGVYEARIKGNEERLTIGKTSNLRMRVRQGLVKGNVPHSSGDKIRTREDTSMVEIRWSQTNRPAAVEEELHIQYNIKHGKNPKYVDHT